MNHSHISVLLEDLQYEQYAESFAKELNCQLVRNSEEINTPFFIAFSHGGTEVCAVEGKKVVRLKVSFSSGAQDHRRKFGGGNGQAIAKAVGLNKGVKPKVLDATAGLGGDAFVLASLGCEVNMIERSPIARSLLQDGLLRAKNTADLEDDDELKCVLSRLQLMEGDSLDLLADLAPYDVVYLDPMFPERKKSASVKKEMKIFHSLIGADDDADELLPKAMDIATYRVVVKRPKIAPFLSGKEPTYQIKGKSTRYDIYVAKAFSTNK